MIESVLLPWKGLGLHMPRERYQRGTLKKIKSNGRMVWHGRWNVYVDVNGLEKRRPKEKILGPATLLRSDAQRLLDSAIEETTGRRAPLPRQTTVEDIWVRYVNLKTPSWSSATARGTKSVFSRCVLPVVGTLKLKDLTFDRLQAVLNRMASNGYRRSALAKARTYMHALCEYAIDEHLLERNPARKLEIPRVKKSCERFYTMEEVGARLGRTTRRPQPLPFSKRFGHSLPTCELSPTNPQAVSRSSWDQRHDIPGTTPNLRHALQREDERRPGTHAPCEPSNDPSPLSKNNSRERSVSGRQAGRGNHVTGRSGAHRTSRGCSGRIGEVAGELSGF
jgi:hypothetical protein